jgi:hypothetical protein
MKRMRFYASPRDRVVNVPVPVPVPENQSRWLADSGTDTVPASIGVTERDS